MNVLRMQVLFALLLLCTAAQAHQSSTAYFTGALGDAGLIEGKWQVRLYDLERVMNIDADGNGTLLWGELLARKTDVSHYLRSHLSITRGGNACSLLIDDLWQVTEHFNEGYLVLTARAQCAVHGDLSFHYDAFFDQDSDHKMLLSLSDLGLTKSDDTLAVSRIFSDRQRQITVNSASTSLFDTAQEFVFQGVIHIWKGLDHVLFLLSLLLTCVLAREGGRWVGEKSVRHIIVNTTWIVTAFTLAHSLTLTATAFNWINLSSRWVEVGIAASVVAAALNNIYPLILRLGWMTFGFGLLHGMGFAGVLGELGVPADQKVLTVLSFNLGVELGQLAIVAVVLPLLILMRHKSWYSRYGVFIASVAISLMAIKWVYERL